MLVLDVAVEVVVVVVRFDDLLCGVFNLTSVAPGLYILRLCGINHLNARPKRVFKRGLEPTGTLRLTFFPARSVPY